MLKTPIFALLFIILISLMTGNPQRRGSQVQAASESFFPFPTVNVTVDFNSNGPGSNVDTIAFWEAPNPAESLMFVTAKSSALVEVWKYPFTVSTALQHSCITTSNGVFVDQDADMLYVSVPRSTNVCVFTLPDLIYQRTITSYNNTVYGIEPNLTMLSVIGGGKQLYISNDRTVDIHLVTSGAVNRFIPTKGLEAMWGDNFHQLLYIPDENGRTGVYVYNPDGTVHYRNGVSKFGSNSIFNSDEEGVTVYACAGDEGTDNGDGLIIVSDQITNSTMGNDYEVFDRQTWEYLGKFKLKLPNGKYVSNTDGIASTQQSSPLYPLGIFTAIQNDSSAVGVSWLKIFNAISTAATSEFGCSNETPNPTPTEVTTSSPTPTDVMTSSPTPTDSVIVTPTPKETPPTESPTPTETPSTVSPTPTIEPGSTVSLSPVEDAHVSSGSPTNSYGSAVSVIASNYSSSNIRTAYLKFNLEDLAGKTITDAKLVLTPNLARKVEKTVRLVVNNSWTETTLNWKNKPPVGTIIGNLPMQNVVVGIPVEITLDPSFLQSASGGIFSIAIENMTTANTFEFHSSEAVSGRPVLVITTSTDIDTTPTP